MCVLRVPPPHPFFTPDPTPTRAASQGAWLEIDPADPGQEEYLANHTVQLLSSAEWRDRLAAAAPPVLPASRDFLSCLPRALFPGEPQRLRDVHLLGFAPRQQANLGTFRWASTVNGQPTYCKEGPGAGRKVWMWWHEGCWNVSADYQPFALNRSSLKFRGFSAAPDQLPHQEPSSEAGAPVWRQFNVAAPRIEHGASSAAGPANTVDPAHTPCCARAKARAGRLLPQCAASARRCAHQHRDHSARPD